MIVKTTQYCRDWSNNVTGQSKYFGCDKLSGVLGNGPQGSLNLGLVTLGNNTISRYGNYCLQAWIFFSVTVVMWVLPVVPRRQKKPKLRSLLLCCLWIPVKRDQERQRYWMWWEAISSCFILNKCRVGGASEDWYSHPLTTQLVFSWPSQPVSQSVSQLLGFVNFCSVPMMLS